VQLEAEVQVEQLVGQETQVPAWGNISEGQTSKHCPLSRRVLLQAVQALAEPEQVRQLALHPTQL
jgi:hypothetical protein